MGTIPAGQVIDEMVTVLDGAGSRTLSEPTARLS